MSAKGIFAGLISGLLWGITGILYSKLNVLYPVTTVISVILLILFIVEFMSGVLVGSSILVLYKRNFTSDLTKKSIFLAILLGIIGGPIGMLCYLQSISLIGVGYAAPISSIYPVFGALLSFAFLKDKIRLIGVLGVLLTLICTFFLSLDVNEGNISLLGILLALVCAFSWGTEIVLSSYVMQLMGKVASSKYAYALRQVGASLGYLLLLIYFKINFSALSKEIIDINFDFFIIGIILSSMFSYLLYYYAIDKLRPIRAMMLNITYGVWIVLLGLFINNSMTSFKQFILVLGILLGSIIVLRAKKES